MGLFHRPVTKYLLFGSPGDSIRGVGSFTGTEPRPWWAATCKFLSVTSLIYQCVWTPFAAFFAAFYLCEGSYWLGGFHLFGTIVTLATLPTATVRHLEKLSEETDAR